MAPKKKNAKKGGDDWEAELGEDPIAAATQEAKDAEATQDGAEDPISGGGLMAALKKNKANRKRKGKIVEEDFVDGEDPPDANGVNGHAEPDGIQELAIKAPEEANADDLFDAQATKTKGGKGKGGKREGNLAPNEDQGASGDEGGTIKSKKEKEKEKKEREKRRKKEQAAAKKKTAPTPAVKEELTKPAVENKPEPAPAAADAGKSKKKLPPALAALQKQQEALKRQQEEQARATAEEKARIEEEERLAAEEEKRKEEARARKKEKDKEKKEQLKKEGKLLTPAQREANRRNEMKREQMLAAGVTVAGLGEESGEKKKPVYDNKKKKGLKKPGDDARAQEEKEAAEAEARRQAEEAERLRLLEEEKAKAEAAAAEEPESDGLEDWEAAADADSSSVKESWEDSDEDEESTKPTSKPPPKVASKNEGAPERTSTKAEIPARPAKPPHSQPKPTSESKSNTRENPADIVDSASQQAATQRPVELAPRRNENNDALATGSRNELRSPICCILGHVDTGKTKLLDKVRQTNVQEGEAGGITQQIGATYFPADALEAKTQVVNKDGQFKFNVPGLLVIDTPGHESFANLRSRGSSLCNIAILVVDIMHGLEPQTLESMRLLRDRKTPFIVALNKIDRLYGWKKIDNNGFQESFALQNKGVQNEFRDRLEKTKLAFSEQGFNSEVFYENKSMARNVSLVPTSAHTGEGIPDMLKLLVTLTQERMTRQLMYLSEVECTVLEVKVIEGLGTTIDVILSNGVLREGDTIVLCGLQGAITTTIRALLTPAPLKELRLKSQYVHNSECKASLGVKIAANDLEHAIAGSRLLVKGPEDDEDDLEEEVMSDIENLLSRVSKTGRGVSVQASTLGSLEALLEFLKEKKIPVANISIGPVYKRDVMQAGVMLEKAKEYAVMLCFDVKVDKEAQAYAEDQGITIFTANIIYHLFDDFTRHMAQLAEQKKEDSKLLAVFPCVLTPVAVFNKKDPIVVGVDVTEGNLRLLTPIAAVRTNPITNVKDVVKLGRVQSIERDHKQIPICKKGQPSVAVKIEGPDQPLYGRHLEEKDTLYSLISRPSIDTLKEFYREDVSNEEWALIKKLKGLFDIP
ncbi:eukaryotic translation initiation factor 5B [Lecanora helva]